MATTLDLVKKSQKVKVLDLKRNLGKARALNKLITKKRLSQKYSSYV